MLWLWVVVVVPAVLVALVNMAIGQDPAALLRRRAVEVLDAVIAAFAHRGCSAPSRVDDRTCRVPPSCASAQSWSIATCTAATRSTWR